MMHLPFENRVEAGRLLAEELKRCRLDPRAAIFALTRGGVPVGFEVADRLRLPLDVIVARKIGVPWQPELAMGAIAGSVQVLDARLIEQLGIADEDVRSIIEREKAEVKRREELFRERGPAVDPEGRTAVIVDDGLATGSTMLASVRYARTLKPSKIIIAIPVGSREGCARLRGEADELVCLSVPELFFAVGEWYRDFEQVTDDEVRRLLALNRKQLDSHSGTRTAA